MHPANAYQYPFFATIKGVTDSNITIHKRYTWGDKMGSSHDLDETVTFALDGFRYFAKGEPTTANADIVGKLIMVFPETNIQGQVIAMDYWSITVKKHLLARNENLCTTAPVVPHSTSTTNVRLKSATALPVRFCSQSTI